MAPLYTIAIAVHNQLHLTMKCLESLKITKDLSRVEIIVVNNASTDETASFLSKSEGMGVATLVATLEENVGVGKAYNYALELSRSPYFVTLNNDVEILDSEWLEKMKAKFEEDPLMGAVGLDAPDVCWSIDANGHGYQGKEFEYVEGAVMMVKTDIVRSLEGGLFDPIYRFAYFEDNDLSLRLRRAGYHIGRVPVKVKHQRCGTVGAVINQGVDIDGFHRINEEIYKGRWGRYIESRDFQESWGIKRSGANGDVLFLTPIIREIKRQNAEAIISVYTHYREILAENPDCYTTLAPPGPPEAYTHWVDLDGAYERRPNMHIIEAYQEVCGVRTKDWRLRLYPGEEARKKAKEVTWKEPYAVLHPHIGQHWLGRNPPESLFVEVSNWLRGRGFKVVLAGIIYTPGIPCDLNLEGKTTLREAAAVIEGAGLFFGVDSALMNFAQALEVPTVGVFGCMEPKNILLPGVKWVTSLTARPLEVGCLGCHVVYKERPKGSPGKCVREQGDVCMKKIRIEDAVSAIERVLGAKQ